MSVAARASRAQSFSVITGRQVQQVLHGREPEITELVADAYRLHAAGASVNPRSYFLRFPDRPRARIIALPASVGGRFRTDGIKWISSFPDNVADGLPRASAVLILNDHDTGYPYACLEASIISATRTAAMAALAADRLSAGRQRPRRIGFIGTGLIARYIHTFLTGNGWTFDRIGLHDTSAEHVAGFGGYLHRSGTDGFTSYATAEELITGSDLVVLATVAAEPHLTDPACFDHHPLVLHVSLRDLAPAVLLRSANFVDDVDHCLQAGTSPHLTEQLTGSRDFLDGTLADVIAGRAPVPEDRPVIFSPFGLGVLDLAVGGFVHDELAATGELGEIPDFFHERHRYG